MRAKYNKNCENKRVCVRARSTYLNDQKRTKSCEKMRVGSAHNFGHMHRVFAYCLCVCIFVCRASHDNPKIAGIAIFRGCTVTRAHTVAQN